MSTKDLLAKLIADRFDGSQAEFARAIGKKPAQVNHWLTGFRNMSQETARYIEKKMKLPFCYFEGNHKAQGQQHITKEQEKRINRKDWLFDLVKNSGGIDSFYESNKFIENGISKDSIIQWLSPRDFSIDSEKSKKIAVSCGLEIGFLENDFIGSDAMGCEILSQAAAAFGERLFDLTPEEESLVVAYRKASPAMKEGARKMLDVVIPASKPIAKTA